MCVRRLVSSSSTSSGSMYIDPRVSRKCSGFQSVSLQTILNDCEILRLPLFGRRRLGGAPGDVVSLLMLMSLVTRCRCGARYCAGRDRRLPVLPPPPPSRRRWREESSRAAVGSRCIGLLISASPPAPVHLFMFISVIRPIVLAPPRALFTLVAPAPDTPGRNQRRVITLIRKQEVVSTARLNKTLEDI